MVCVYDFYFFVSYGLQESGGFLLKTLVFCSWVVLETQTQYDTYSNHKTN